MTILGFQIDLKNRVQEALETEFDGEDVQVTHTFQDHNLSLNEIVLAGTLDELPTESRVGTQNAGRHDSIVSLEMYVSVNGIIKEDESLQQLKDFLDRISAMFKDLPTVDNPVFAGLNVWNVQFRNIGVEIQELNERPWSVANFVVDISVRV